MVRSVIRRLGLTVLSLMVLLGSMISFPTVTVYAAIEGDFEYGPAFAEGVKITAYHGATGGHVDIPNQLGGLTVTEIGYEAFMEKGLTSVTIPNSVTYIHERAFYSNQLTSITLPTNISTVGIEAFKNNQLTSLTIPSSINIIAQAAFEGNKLTSLNLPAKNFNISIQAFRYNELTSLIIPEGMTYVGVEVFQGNKLTSLSLPNSLTHLARDSFKDNELTTLTIPASVTQINQSAFEGNNLSSLTILSNELVIKESAFRNNKLSELTIPEGVLSIGTDAFQYNELTSLSLPSSLTTIGNGVFKNNKLSELTIPEGVLSIGADAFQYNELTSLSLPSSLTAIGDGAFKNNKLSELTIPEGVLSIGEVAFQYNELTSLSLPSSLTTIGNGVFKNNKLSELTIPEGVLSIGADAFQYNNLTSLSLPSSLTTIGDGAFKDNELSELTIPEGVLSIDAFAFQYNNLTSLSLPSSLTTIGDGAFRDNKLSELTIPEGVLSIGAEAFLNNDLTSLSLPSSLTTIGNVAFQNNELTELTLPNSVTTIGAGAFEANKLSSINFSINLHTIEDGVFKNNLLTSLVIPNYVTSIKNEAFASNRLESLTLPDNGLTIGMHAFNDNQLVSLTIPNSIYVINVGAFRYNKLTSVTLSESITSLSAEVFEYNELTSLQIPESVSTIQANAFKNNKLTSLILPEDLVFIGEGAFEGNEISSLIFLNSDVFLANNVFRDNQLTSLTIPEGMERIRENVFQGNKLTSLTLPDSLTRIDSFTFSYNELQYLTIPKNMISVYPLAFSYNPSLSDVLILSPTVELRDEHVFYNSSPDLRLHGYAGSTAETYAATIGATFQPINAELEDIQLNIAGFTFDPVVRNFNVMTNAASVIVTPIARSPFSIVTVNDEPVIYGESASAIPLVAGVNSITIDVEAADGNSSEQYKIVLNVNQTAPTLNLSATPTTPTNGNVTINIEAVDAGSGIVALKWTTGNENVAFFATGGQNVVDDKFEVSANGTYTVYARDGAGNEVVKTITVSNIASDAPVISLTAMPTTPTNGNVTIEIEMDGASSGLASFKWAAGNQDEAFFATGGQNVVDDKIEVTANGTYTVYARDNAGNEVVETINVGNIDKTAPTLDLTPSTVALTFGNVTVAIKAEDADSGIAQLKWSTGNRDASFFAEGGQVVVDDKFMAFTNGIYTVYARDAAGNEVVRTINISNIDKIAPMLALTATPTAPTNGNVTVAVEAEDAVSGIAELKWAAGNQNQAFFETGGQNVVDDQFVVSGNGIYTAYARDVMGNGVVRTINVTNIDKTAPTLALTATPTAPTNGNVTVAVEAEDADSGIAELKWTAGNQNAAFFATGGQNVVDDQFVVSANGIYTVYAQDAAGNEIVRTINVSNIDRTAPTFDLTPSTIAPTNGNVTVAVEAEDADSGIAQLKWAAGNQNAAFFAAGGQNVVDDEFVASVNGIYTVYARDTAGNEVVRTINVTNIDKTAPTLALLATPTVPTNGNVTVEVEGNGTGSAITSLKWATGNQNVAYFATGGQNVVGGEIEITVNGDYTVYARDAAGNEAVETITVSNIDRVAPSIALTASPTAPTSGDVTINVDAEDTDSGISELMWAAGNQVTAFFATGGQNVAADEFEVTANGVYTVYARDVAGNEALATIEVNNIDRNEPTINLTATPTGLTNGDVTITVESEGTGSAIDIVKWVAGNEDVAYFASGGQDVVDEEFAVTANGVYTVYARDAAGNETVRTITVGNIDRNAPTINLTADPIEPTSGDVTVTVEAEDTDSGISELMWAAGDQDAAYFVTGGQEVVDDEFAATTNGIYTVYARDTAGNEYVRTIEVSNIDRDVPTIALTADPTTSTRGNVTVTVESDGTGSTITSVKWAAGIEDATFFVTGGQELSDDVFEVTANGTYTVYARDAAGNEAVSSITISNIVRSNPTPPSNDTAPRTSVTIDKDIIVIEVSPRDIREVPTDNGGTKAIVTLPNDVWNEIPKLLNEADRPVITIVITGDLPDVEVHLPSIRVNELMDINSNVQFDVQRNKSSFQLLVNILDMEQLAKQLGIPVDELDVIIKITELTGEAKQQFILAAEEQGLRLLSEVIQFQLLVSGGDKLVEITDFGGTYMTKSILLDSQLTTRNYLVVLYDPDRRTFSYVPAVLEGRSDDQQDAIIQMPHNSIYAIVDAERVQFADMNGHWARSVVEQLGSKRIVKGITSTDFGGNRNITRAEFASLLVRALGIKTDHNGSGEIFQDVSSTSWYALEVEAAFKAGLVNGVSATQFAPDQPITREQIALMLMNAWRLVNDTELTLEPNTSALDAFSDAAEVSSWAREAIAEALSLKLMQGMSADRLAPTELATRAQAAVMLHRFLVLINFLD